MAAKESYHDRRSKSSGCPSPSSIWTNVKNLIVNMGTVELQAITCFDSAQQDKLDLLRRWRLEGLEGFSRGCPKLV